MKPTIYDMIKDRSDAAIFIACLYPKMTTIAEFESLVIAIMEQKPEAQEIFDHVNAVVPQTSAQYKILQRCFYIL